MHSKHILCLLVFVDDLLHQQQKSSVFFFSFPISALGHIHYSRKMYCNFLISKIHVLNSTLYNSYPDLKCFDIMVYIICNINDF